MGKKAEKLVAERCEMVVSMPNQIVVCCNDTIYIFIHDDRRPVMGLELTFLWIKEFIDYCFFLCRGRQFLQGWWCGLPWQNSDPVMLFWKYQNQLSKPLQTDLPKLLWLTKKRGPHTVTFTSSRDNPSKRKSSFRPHCFNDQHKLNSTYLLPAYLFSSGVL